MGGSVQAGWASTGATERAGVVTAPVTQTDESSRNVEEDAGIATSSRVGSRAADATDGRSKRAAGCPPGADRVGERLVWWLTTPDPSSVAGSRTYGLVDAPVEAAGRTPGATFPGSVRDAARRLLLEESSAHRVLRCTRSADTHRAAALRCATKPASPHALQTASRTDSYIHRKYTDTGTRGATQPSQVGGGGRRDRTPARRQTMASRKKRSPYVVYVKMGSQRKAAQTGAWSTPHE